MRAQAHPRPGTASLLGWPSVGIGDSGGSELTGVEGVSLVRLWVPEALEPIVSDLEHKPTVYHTVG